METRKEIIEIVSVRMALDNESASMVIGKLVKEYITAIKDYSETLAIAMDVGADIVNGRLIVKEDINARTYDEEQADRDEDEFEAARDDAQEKWVRSQEAKAIDEPYEGPRHQDGNLPDGCSEQDIDDAYNAVS